MPRMILNGADFISKSHSDGLGNDLENVVNGGATRMPRN